MVLRDVCLCKRDASTFVRISHWPLRRDDSTREMIGTSRSWGSDWLRRDVGVLSACRLSALAREGIDSTLAEASGSL